MESIARRARQFRIAHQAPRRLPRLPLRETRQGPSGLPAGAALHIMRISMHCRARAGRYNSTQKMAIAEALNQSLVEALGIPRGDRFVMLSEHGEDELFIDPDFTGMQRMRQGDDHHRAARRASWTGRQDGAAGRGARGGASRRCVRRAGEARQARRARRRAQTASRLGDSLPRTISMSVISRYSDSGR
ncbi:tautomerase family protein [Burkholderia gladioli]|uniref:tautomerase family protein n=2 Tax=Burkholderia gladioli TaxID=28095 RepID=UPI003132E74D